MIVRAAPAGGIFRPSERFAMSYMDEANEFAGEELDQFVPAVFARNGQEAELYRLLLDDHGIPALLGLEDRLARTGRSAQALPGRRSITRTVPVFVPEALLDDAERIIAECPDIRNYTLRRDDRSGDVSIAGAANGDDDDCNDRPWDTYQDRYDDDFEIDFFDEEHFEDDEFEF